MENPLEMDDLGVPLFLETPINIEKLSKNNYHTSFCESKSEQFFHAFAAFISFSTIFLRSD